MTKDLFVLRRGYILIAVMGLWGTVIGARLYFLQVVESSGLRHQAEDQQQKHQLRINPPRGIIYDRNGNELAATVQAKSIFVQPGAFRKEVSDIDGAAKTISRITGMTFAEVSSKLRSEKSWLWIKRKASSAEAAAIEKADIPGVGSQIESQRSYPNEEMAAQVLGFVDLDDQGQAGLEGKYNELIRGESGKVVYISDNHNKSYNQIEQPATPGANLITTIDKNIQHFVEQEVAAAEERTHAKGIYIIVMDPQNGEILAMANYPTYNPNKIKGSDPASFQNGAIVHTYEPGSTFKILTVGAALEEGLTTPEDLIDCLRGSIVVAGTRIRDHKAFDVLTVSEILQKSSDVGAITLGLRLKEDRMAKYMKLYGFGRTTEIDLPAEERGKVRPVSQWDKSSIGYISMGQQISVTPLQIVNLVSVVANGGTLYRPYVVREVQGPGHTVISHTEPVGERVMSQKTALQMQDMLEKVVTSGTATTAKLDGYRAAGKTGTAQKSDGKGYSATKLVASFAGYAPVSNPAFSMVVVVDEPVGSHMGGEVAAPIFKNIANRILQYKGVPTDIEGYAPRYTTAPAKRESTAAPAAKPSAPPELKVVSTALADPVKPSQPGDITVPDFRGKSMTQLDEECQRLGLVSHSEGRGHVVTQNPPAGTQVRHGAVVDLRLAMK